VRVFSIFSFAAGVGNYAGATAGAIGAFYRPNEDVMFSIGGTAGNGENMVNLGLSFAIGQGSSGVAKLSKAELVTKVQNMEAKCISVDAENKELRHEINNAKAENQKLQDRIAKLEAMVMKLAAK
jgi:outer membrane murein-binding lipoprotein Lpp